jgi:hypothetical protein
MAATISFIVGSDFVVNDLSGSGIGFYGDSGFGASVRVGEYQGRSFITNSTGTSQGAEIDNVKYLNAGSGILGQSGSGIALTCVPNYQNTLQIRFTYDSAVRTQNVRLYGYDRYNINNAPSGVTLKAFEGIHPGITQANTGSGDTTWVTMAGSGSYLSLCPSPGVSGQYAGNGANGAWSDTTHDWYVGLSASPDSIGSKTQFGISFQVEYL